MGVFRGYREVSPRAHGDGEWTSSTPRMGRPLTLGNLVRRYISVAEDLTTPYEWGVYDTLVLPPSFPYGGKLHPILPTLWGSLTCASR